MTRRTLGVVACVLAAHGAVAAPPGYTLSPDTRIVAVTGAHAAAVTQAGPAGYRVIFDNLASRDPLGVYMAGLGFAFGGPKSPIGVSSVAAAFTPQHSATVQALQVGAGIIEGRNEVAVSIYADASGAPGAVLWQGTARMPPSGGCCATALATGVSLPLTAGTRYWLGLGAAPDGAGTFAAWSFNVADQVRAGQTAFNVGAGWMVSPSRPTVAFALYGE